MAYETYKVLHIFGILLIFLGLGGTWGLHALKPSALDRKVRVGIATLHGVGLVITLVAGFGLLARLNYFQNIPTWAYIKILIWILLGGSVALAKRKAQLGVWLLLGFTALGTLGAILAIYKPDF